MLRVGGHISPARAHRSPSLPTLAREASDAVEPPGWVGAALLVCGLAAVAVPPCSAAAQGSWPPRVSLGDGAFVLEPTGILQLDLGTTFAHNRPGGPGAGWNPRRARLGVEGEFLRDFQYGLAWDFGGTPGDRNGLYEASLSYRGFGPVTLTGGVFEPSFSLQQEQGAKNLLFLERSAVSQIAANIAAGSSRVGAQTRAYGERWFAAAALTGGKTGPGTDSSQRGAVLRLAGLPVRTEEAVLHLGFSGAWSFRPARGEGGRRGVSFSESGELELDRRDPALRTGGIPADDVRVGGAEFGLAWRRLQLQGEWYGIAVDRGGGRGGTLDFSGWYAQASYTLQGRPRRYQPDSATWGAPGSDDDAFNPREGRWGALEVAARVSVLDLNDRDIRGGRQRTWAGGLGWWPVADVGAFLQWQHVAVVGRPAGDRRYQALALRVLAAF